MPLPGLKTVVISSLLSLVMCLFGVFVIPCQAVEGIAPDRNISVVVSEPAIPEWKALWDKARNHARKQEYTQAVSLYSALFKIKPNIEEANWEYCKVLLKVEDFVTVKKIVSGLLEKYPNRIDYLFVGGQTAAHAKEWVLAAKYYGKVLEMDPGGELADAALQGLAVSLKAQGKNQAAFALTEQLLARKPSQTRLLQEGALAAQKLGYNDKARKLYSRLLAAGKVDDQIIFSAANAFDSPGYEKQGSALREEYLKRHPEYVPFRRKLTQYYLSINDFEAAIPHITYLAENLPENDEFLILAGTVNLYQLRRADKALVFFEKYQTKHPDDAVVKEKIDNIQSILANDFLAIVENDGAGLLWNDLEKVTPNRAAIYLEMADLLESKGAAKALIDVLSILHQHFPDDDTTALRIADQYYKLGQLEHSLSYLEKVKSQENKKKTYYLLRGNIEKTLGSELAALASWEAGWKADPDDRELRMTCLQLAGKLGLAGELKKIFREGMKHDGGRLDHAFFFTYLDLLSSNFLFKLHEETVAQYKNEFANEPDSLAQINLLESIALRREGKNRKAEQLLRSMLVEGRSGKEVLFTLMDNAIADRNIAAAQIWYDTLSNKVVKKGDEFSQDEDGYKRLLRKVRILKYSGEYEAAVDLISKFTASNHNDSPTGKIIDLRVALEKERCWLAYYMEDYKNASLLAESSSLNKDFDPDIYILKRLLKRKMKTPDGVGPDLEASLAVHGNPLFSRIIGAINSELVYEQYDLVDQHLQTILKGCSQSVAGNILSVRFHLAKGKFNQAFKPLTQLIETFPQEPYFSRKLIEIETKRGRYDKGLELLGQSEGGASGVDALVGKIASSDDIDETLTLARLLWGDKQQEKALKVYNQLLSPPVLEVLIDNFQKKQINYLYLTREKTLWNSMMLLLQSEPEVIGELMEPQFLVDNLSNDAGAIVASHYELYSWQKMISDEYLARKATYEKNYYSAEQSYKRLLDQEKTTEGMIDLAAVYGRTGQYRKEAQVYEEIQQSGVTSPELVNSMERSAIQMSPQNLLDFSYEEKNGRSGFIDISKMSVGSSFWFAPDLDKDIRLVYANNRYESINANGSVGSNSLYASGIYEFAKDYELILGGGTEKIDGSSDTRFLHNMTIKGQLDQYFNAYLTWQKFLIYDTVTAIKEGISAQGVETGLICETPFGIGFGGDFRNLSYSDGNSENRFHGFTSYGLYGENVQLSLRYDYKYLNNRDSNPSKLELTEEEEIPDTAFYWSPDYYSEHKVTLHFQHDFLGYQQGTKRGVSYYSIDNGLASEDDQFISYSGKFNIFLEMSPHFLLKGNFTFAKSDDYDETGLFLSLHYRW